MLKSIAITTMLLYGVVLYGQRSATYTDANLHYKQGLAHYQDRLYGLAKSELAEAVRISSLVYDEKSHLLAEKALFLSAKASLYGKFPGGEKAVMDFYRKKRPSPLAYEAIKVLGDLEFQKKRYAEALVYYALVDTKGLTEKDRDAVLFKTAYAQFLGKDFQAATRNFAPLLGKDTDYYFQVYYYMAMITFYEGRYDEAIEYFFLLENYPDYKTRIPYYISQIYFEQRKYEDVLDYIPAQLQLYEVENVKEMRHILGQTYFLKGDYKEALPQLEYYESKSRKMRKEDFYQLAFSQYQLGRYEKAANNFKELSNLPTEMGQISNNYLGDASLKMGNKEEARVSFKKVMEYEMNEDLRQEAAFNFGKLSAELGYDRAAIATLVEISPSAGAYAGAQKVLGELFESSKDYTMVIRTIEGLENKSPEVLKAYQKVVLERSIQLMNDGNKALALSTLLKAAQSPVDNYYTAIIYYHIADLKHQAGDYTESENYLNQYFTLSALTNTLPQSVSPAVAHYIQGYNHLKLKDYTNALSSFNSSHKLMASEGRPKDRMYADVLNRKGDIFFAANKYVKASANYEEASQLEFPGRDYAFFQWAMIRGLQGNPYEKIVLLENLMETVPSSSFTDDAYFQMGETQMALNQPRPAELAYAQILQLKRSSPLITRALLKLGLIAYNKGETQKAIQYYTDLFDNNPSKTEAQEALLALEEIYISDLGRAEDFAEVVEKATGYKMSNLERDSLSYTAAQGRFENGEYVEAIDSYTNYIDKFPNGINFLQAVFNRAESKVILKRYAEALPDYDKIIEAGQSSFYEDAIHKAALITYNDIQQFDEAFNYYALLSDVTEDEVLKYESQVGAMRSAYRLEQASATLAYTGKVITNSLSTKEEKGLANFYAGRMNQAKGNIDGAKLNYEQVLLLTDNEKTAEARFLRNEILFKQGEVEIAEEVTLESISSSTAYPYWVAKNLILLSEIMVANNDLFNAKAAVEAVIENFKESDELQEAASARLKSILSKEKDATRLEDETTINLDTINRNE